MEIENNRLASVATQLKSQSAPVEKYPDSHAKAATDGASSNGSTDRVSLTDQTQQLRQLEARLTGQPVVDSQRVAAARSAVENGTYAVNPERIADKLISLQQALTDAR